ncbi:glycosyltransferase family 4 protein [bacterium]|nr:glycosyltransferase family 4 protein [candidate division CSSED10-310 bacterium]
MKIGFVAQRYGLDIAGGAELHCRLVAEHLSKRHSVEVFTTCAKDYVTWRNEYRPGTEEINGVAVRRFKVRKGRNIRTFEDVQNLVFHERQSKELEERWIRENGPFSPSLVNTAARRTDIDAWILFSYRYWTTVQILRIHKGRALLVPTAEHDPALYLGIVKDLFQLPRGIIYNSIEERSLIQSITGNQSVPGDIVGVGLPESDASPVLIKKAVEKFSRLDPYILYVGRIDKNKGCDHLFRMYRRFYDDVRSDIRLVLIGKSVVPVPDHPGILNMGFLSEEEKEAAYRHCRLLIMPSQYESLSMVLLEAWRFARPALVNGRCEVLSGQCRRSNGGLAYNNYDEFAAGLEFLIRSKDASERIGAMGHNYFEMHYRWPVIEGKYEALLKLVAQDGMQRR